MASDIDWDSSEQVRLLCDLGLTPVQSKVYLALQERTGLPARSLVDSLRINRVDVYRALKHLQTMGLIEVSIGNPNKYIAMKPRLAIKLLLKDIEADVGLLRKKAFRLTKSLEVRPSVASGERVIEGSGQFFRLKNGEGVINSIHEMIGSAQTEIRKVVTVRALGFHILYGVADIERKLAKKGVEVKIMTDIKSEGLKEYANFAKIRYVGNLSDVLRYIIVDDRLVMISLAANAMGPTDSVGLLTNNNTLVQALTNQFDDTWSKMPV